MHCDWAHKLNSQLLKIVVANDRQLDLMGI